MSVKRALSYSSSPDAQVVGLYFGADYCKYCHEFVPELKRLYPHLLARGIEIVLIGSDKTEQAYDGYRAHQPWPAARFDDGIRGELRDEFLVKTIPQLIFLDQDGNVVNRDGRALIDTASINDNSRKAAEWVASHLGFVDDGYCSDSSDF